MKRWLAISLLLNSVLLGLLLSATRQTNTNNASPTNSPATPDRADLSERKISTSQSMPVAKARGNDWHSWLDELRAAGVPDKVLASLVTADFENRWETRQAELQRRYENGEVDAEALTQAEANHAVECEKELRAALGEEGFRQWDKDKTLREMNLATMNLSTTESDALYQLRKNLLQQRHDLEQASRNGELDEADLGKKLSALQTQYEAQMKALLGDDRYATMNSAPDPTSAQLRRELKSANPNDEQFAALLQAQRQWNQQHADLDRKLEESHLQSGAYEQQIQAIDAARDEVYQQVLSTNEFAAFQMEQDNRYQTLKHYASAWQLSDRDIDYLYRSMQFYDQSVKNYQEQAKAMEAQGESVDWNGVQNNLRQFSEQTQQSLTSYLGADRFNKLKANDLFNWNASPANAN